MSPKHEQTMLLAERTDTEMTHETSSLSSFNIKGQICSTPTAFSKRDDAFLNWQTKYEAPNPIIPEEELSPRNNDCSGAMDIDNDTEMTVSFSLL